MTQTEIEKLPEAGPGRRIVNGRAVREDMLRSVAAPDLSALTAATKGVSEEHKA